ncbi:MAG: branched-chain amino acid aminotransferase [Anaerovoracaceae bacterium]|jgi:branched-chain amino acid aminotransferase
MNNFTFEKTTTPKQKPDPDSLVFGQTFTDHMFIMEYHEGQGWYDGRIVPYAPLCLDPASVVFHYGQEMFEGLKAYKTAQGKIQLFRPEMNARRTNQTNDRLCMPQIDEDLYVDAIKELVAVDADWIPEKEGTALYIRPFIIGTEPCLGVRASKSYMFIVILSPVGPYYKGGLAPTKLYVEDHFVRAAKGGTGEAKCGGNYASGLKAQALALEKGFEQILWLDGNERKYVEEIGTSNAFFIIDDEVITAPLDGTILPGITRDSVIHLLKDKGIKISERKITIDEVFNAAKSGRLTEVFASGTAAVISPVGELSYKGEEIVIHGGEIGPIAQMLYDTLYGIQTGHHPDPYGWTVGVK